MATDSNGPTIDIKQLDVTPNECDLTASLCIKGNFDSSQSFKGKWKIVYIADSAYTKHVIVLGETKCQDIVQNKSTNLIDFNIDKIDVSGVNDATLFNVGILKLTLVQCDNQGKESNEILDVNIITQISQDEKDKTKFIRTFFNPLEQ